MPVLIAETILQDFDQNVLVFPAAAEQDPGQRQAAVGLSGSSAGSRNADGPAGHGEEVLRGDDAQIGIPGDLAGAVAGAVGQIAFGERLQTPGQAAEKVFAMPRTGVFLKQLPVFFAQLAERGAAQLLNLG